jgi:hypothetical protein
MWEDGRYNLFWSFYEGLIAVLCILSFGGFWNISTFATVTAFCFVSFSIFNLNFGGSYNTGKPRFNKSEGTKYFVLYSRDSVIYGLFSIESTTEGLEIIFFITGILLLKGSLYWGFSVVISSSLARHFFHFLNYGLFNSMLQYVTCCYKLLQNNVITSEKHLTKKTNKHWDSMVTVLTNSERCFSVYNMNLFYLFPILYVFIMVNKQGSRIYSKRATKHQRKFIFIKNLPKSNVLKQNHSLLTFDSEVEGLNSISNSILFSFQDIQSVTPQNAHKESS